MSQTAQPEYVELTRDDIENLLVPQARQVVIPAPQGRFLLHIPNLNDGKGPILAPNIKSFKPDIEGGILKSMEYRAESSPQSIETDGTKMIVINRVDKHVARALESKLDETLTDKTLCPNGTLTREGIEDFLTYARGFQYNPLTGEVTPGRSSLLFNTDMYWQDMDVAKKLHFDPTNTTKNLLALEGNLPTGRYVKKAAPTTAIYVDTPIRFEHQTFEHGAIIQIPNMGTDRRRLITMIDPDNLQYSYTWPDGSTLKDRDGTILLPHYSISPQREITPHNQEYVFTPNDMEGLDTIKASIVSPRVYIKPDTRFFEGQPEMSFHNEMDHVNQRLRTEDGILICAFNYRPENEDYGEKSAAFLRGVQEAYNNASNFDELIRGLSELYRDHDIGIPDIYTSTRDVMGLPNLQGVDDKVTIKRNETELLRLQQPDVMRIQSAGDTLVIRRPSDHRDQDQRYVGEVIVQRIPNEGREATYRGVPAPYAAACLRTQDGQPLSLLSIPTYAPEQVYAAHDPQGMQAGSGQVSSAGQQAGAEME